MSMYAGIWIIGPDGNKIKCRVPSNNKLECYWMNNDGSEGDIYEIYNLDLSKSTITHDEEPSLNGVWTRDGFIKWNKYIRNNSYNDWIKEG